MLEHTIFSDKSVLPTLCHQIIPFLLYYDSTPLRKARCLNQCFTQLGVEELDSLTSSNTFGLTRRL